MTVIVFDAFGTLIQTGHPHNPYARLRKASAGADRDSFLTTNRPIEQFARDLGLEHMIPTLQWELQQELQSLQLFPDVAPALAILHAAGRRMALCSNLAHGYGDTVRALLPQMEAHVFSYEVGARKPQAQIFSRVCAAMRCRPRDVLFIGDSLRSDVNGPRDFGMRSLHLNRAAGDTIQTLLDQREVRPH